MVIVALMLGLLAAVAGLAITLGIDITAPTAPVALPSAGELLTPKVLARVVAAVATLLGVLIVLPKRMVGGALMLIGAIGMSLTFEFHRTTAIPVVFSALAAILAIYAEVKRRRAQG